MVVDGNPTQAWLWSNVNGALCPNTIVSLSLLQVALLYVHAHL